MAMRLVTRSDFDGLACGALLLEAGVIDPAKVERVALENAASIAAMVLTTETLVADKPAPEGAANPMAGAGAMGGMPGMM